MLTPRKRTAKKAPGGRNEITRAAYYMTRSYKECPMARSHVIASPSPARSAAGDLARLHALQRAGLAVLRYGLVLLLVLWGGFKFAAFEAEGIQPLVSSSPLLSWLYALF